MEGSGRIIRNGGLLGLVGSYTGRMVGGWYSVAGGGKWSHQSWAQFQVGNTLNAYSCHTVSPGTLTAALGFGNEDIQGEAVISGAAPFWRGAGMKPVFEVL